MRLPRDSRRLPAFLALSAIAACSAAPSSSAERVDRTSAPIIGGTNSTAAQDFVVLIVHPIGNALDEVYECSGTLVAPDLVLTARHCVSSTSDEGFTCDSDGNGSSGGAIGADFDPTSLWIFAGVVEPNSLAPSAATAVGAKLFHDDATNLCDHDVALIALNRPISSSQANIATLGLNPKPLAGDLLTAVGWGVTSNNQTPMIRQQRTNVPIAHVGPFSNSDGEDVPPNEFDVGESICEGDSGSPALDSSNAVIGVASRGGNNVTPGPNNLAKSCEGKQTLNYYSQVGAFRDVILQAFTAMGETPKLATEEELGSFCETSSDCASGPCLGSGDDRYCSTTCAASSPCPSGYSCNTVGGNQVCEVDPPSSGCNVVARAPRADDEAGLSFAGLCLVSLFLWNRRSSTSKI